jgi:hypothetical protein
MRASVMLALLALAGSAGATTIFDTLSGGSLGNRNPTTGFVYGQSFTSGASSTTLSDVAFLLNNLGGAQSTFSVNLYSNSGNAPGSLLTTLATVNDSTVTSGSFNVYHYTTSYTLAANTRYWIELFGATTQVYWSLTSASIAQTAGGTGFVGEYTDDNGSVTQDDPAFTRIAFQMQVNTTALSSTPEPASILLSLTGLALVALRGGRAIRRR